MLNIFCLVLHYQMNSEWHNGLPAKIKGLPGNGSRFLSFINSSGVNLTLQVFANKQSVKKGQYVVLLLSLIIN